MTPRPSKGANVLTRGWAQVVRNDEEELKKAVATVGPVTVAFDASQRSFQLFSGEFNLKMI